MLPAYLLQMRRDEDVDDAADAELKGDDRRVNYNSVRVQFIDFGLHT